MIFRLKVAILILITIFAIQAIRPASSSVQSWEKINDGTGFHHATAQEPFIFHTRKEQDLVAGSHLYPNYLIFNDSINIGRDAKNGILWFSIRPEIRIVNQSTWPTEFNNKSSWPRRIDGKKFWPTYDSEGKLYYISSRFKMNLYVRLINAYPEYLITYTDPSLCNPSRATQWKPCKINPDAIKKSFPLGTNSTFDEFLDGFTDRKDNVGIQPLGVQKNNSLDDLEFTGNCVGNTNCENKQLNGFFLRSLTYNDYDNFGIKYKVTDHPAWLKMFFSTVAWYGTYFKGVPIVDYDTYGTPLYFKNIYDNSGVNFITVKTPIHSTPYYGKYFEIGPKKESVIFENPHDVAMTVPLTKKLQIPVNPIVEQGNFIFPEVQVPFTSIIDVSTAVAVTATASSAVLVAGGVLAVYQQIQENPQVKSVKRKDKSTKISQQLIQDAISQNKMRK